MSVSVIEKGFDRKLGEWETTISHSFDVFALKKSFSGGFAINIEMSSEAASYLADELMRMYVNDK